MEHSLIRYLERRTTQELEEALKYYMEEERRQNYEYAIEEMLRILKERRSGNKAEE